MKTFPFFLAAAGFLMSSPFAFAQDYPAPTPLASLDGVAEHIQRTMHLLATSTEENPNTVRILFYGQSITDHKPWVDRTIADLRTRFPYANIIAENRAIGGFSSQRLINTAEHDLYPFYPDLLVFHVYGAHDTYEDIIEYTRARTAAEVLIWNDHIGGSETLQNGEYVGSSWTTFMDGFTRDTATKYGAQYVDIREYWNDYLLTNDLQPSALLRDNVHMNDHGDYLLGELIMRELVYKPELEADPDGLMEEIEVSAEDFDEHGDLWVYVAGNRVDVVLAEPDGEGNGSYLVEIDHVLPSSYPGTYTFTRPQPDPWSGQTSLNRVDSYAPRVLEDWTLTVDEVFNDYFTFSVEGTVTGPDGSGRSDQTFISNSQRVVIDQEDGPGSTEVTKWFAGASNNPQTMDPGDTVTWTTVGHFADEVVYPANATGHLAVTVIQGISNETHLLRLTRNGEDAPAVRSIRVYRPFWDRGEKFWTDQQALAFAADAGSVSELSITAEGNWSITGLPAWLTANLSSGNASALVTLEADANVATEVREGLFKINRSGFEPLEITVHQEAAPPAPRESIFRAEGETEDWILSGLGWVYDGDYPWVYSLDMGWFYVYNDDLTQFYFYLPQHGWALGIESVLPWVYVLHGANEGWHLASEMPK